MVRARGSHPRGHWFESSIAHQLSLATLVASLLLLCLTPAQPAARAAGADVNSLGLTAAYNVNASFDWDERSADVSTEIQLSNNVRWPVTEVAFNLATLRTGHARVEVSVTGVAVAASVDDQTVIVPLPLPLAPGETTQLTIHYSGRLAASASADGDAWEFAIIDDVLTAYRWIPWLSRPTPFNRPNVGDPFVTASSPHVRVAITVDRPVTIASTGRRVGEETGAQVFEASDVRDFNFAASPSYQTASRSVGATEVTFFYRTLPANKVLATAARALRAFSRRVAPYPHEHLTIAEVGPWAPFESPAHFWLPDNAPGRLLDWMVAHEVAHQWFYSAVGNDQAREPFADEALSDYMARDLLNSFVPSQCPVNRLDHSIYDISDCYAWVVYVQGNEWLRRLSQRVGARPFWEAVADYYVANRNGMGSTYALLASLARGAGRAAVDFERFPRTFPARLISLPFGPRLP